MKRGIQQKGAGPNGVRQGPTDFARQRLAGFFVSGKASTTSERLQYRPKFGQRRAWTAIISVGSKISAIANLMMIHSIAIVG